MKTVKFTKTLGRFKPGQTRRVTDGDAKKLERIGVAEVLNPSEGVTPVTNTRMLTTGKPAPAPSSPPPHPALPPAPVAKPTTAKKKGKGKRRARNSATGS